MNDIRPLLFACLLTSAVGLAVSGCQQSTDADGRDTGVFGTPCSSHADCPGDMVCSQVEDRLVCATPQPRDGADGGTADGNSTGGDVADAAPADTSADQTTDTTENDDGTSDGSESGDADGSDAIPTWKQLGGGEPYVKARRRAGETTYCEAPESATVVSDRSEFLDALDAAGSGDIVYLAPEAAIQIGNATHDVPSGVTIASNRGCEGADGGMLVNAERDDTWRTLIAEEGARFFGIRMKGPHPDKEYHEYQKPVSIGVSVEGRNVEFANNELFGFSHASIRLKTPKGVRIHHNSIHHNAMMGLGYGVVLNGDGTKDTIIEYNYFNYNKHSIANHAAGYTARYNRFGPQGLSYAMGTHVPGGSRIVIHHNTVEFSEHLSNKRENEQPYIGSNITIRGVPGDKAEIHHNWLYNPREPLDQPNGWTDEAIIQPVDDEKNELSSWKNVEFHDNHYGSDDPQNCDIGAPRKGCAQ